MGVLSGFVIIVVGWGGRGVGFCFGFLFGFAFCLFVLNGRHPWFKLGLLAIKLTPN